MSIMEGGIAVAMPETSYRDSRRFGYKTAGLTVTTEYTNYTKSDIYLKSQNNLAVVIEPNTTAAVAECSKAHIEIKVTYTIHNSASIFETMSLLQSMVQNGQVLSGDATHILDKLTQIYAADANRNNKLNFTASVFRRVLEDDIRRQRLLYLRDSDILISVDKAKMLIPHPNSNEGMQQTDIELNRTYQGQAGVFVKVVDNDHLAKMRYYYAGKRLVTVPSIVDETKDSGVYVTCSTMADDGLVSPVSNFLTFEEAANQIGLYRTREEALSHGDPDQILRTEEARNKTEERRLATELRDVKHKAELLGIEKEQELTHLKHALEIARAETAQFKEAADTRKIIREDTFEKSKRYREDYYDSRDKRRKDHYEDRSYKRKDTSELVKFIPAMILGMIGTFAFMKAQSPSK